MLCGFLIGEAKHGTVRASVFAPAAYQPQRLSDLFCRHKLSRQALMAQLTEPVLTILYPSQVFYFAPRRQPKRGRPRSYGQKCRVDRLVKHTPSRLQHQSTTLKIIRGKERTVRVYDAELLKNRILLYW